MDNTGCSAFELFNKVSYIRSREIVSVLLNANLFSGSIFKRIA